MELGKNTTSPSHNTGLNSRTFSVKGNCRLLGCMCAYGWEVSAVSEQLYSLSNKPWTRPSRELSHWEQRFSSASVLLGIKRLDKALPVIVMPTWCGNQGRVHACMTISLRPVHILSDLMATYADKEITQNKILRCSLDVCNGRGLHKVWLIASADNSQAFWVLLAVCFVWSNLESSDLWPVQLGASTFLLALYSTDYWFPFKMWRPSHSDHNLLINVSCSSSPAVVITTIREIEHSGTSLPGSSFLSACLSLCPVSFLSRFLIMSVVLRTCVRVRPGRGDKHQAGGCTPEGSFIF